MSDLPPGYRWASADEADNAENHPAMIVVHRTVDVNGFPYTHDEADLAMPLVPTDCQNFQQDTDIEFCRNCGHHFKEHRP
jgi:hypothetical protein